MLFLVTILISSCEEVDLSKVSEEDVARLAEQVISCENPYIRHASGCCLDANENKICDLDEKLLQATIPVNNEPIEEEIDEELNDIICNRPYMRHAEGCCLDIENNKICDKDESIIEEEEEEEEIEEEIIEEFVCNKPYIRFETKCCLDKNKNRICDKHEGNDENNEEEAEDNDDDDEIIIDFEGKVLIEEYGDFECPFCGKAYPIIKKLQNEFGNKIKFEFNHFPLSFHKNAQSSAEASECARDQGKFTQFHDILFENQREFSRSMYLKWADDLNLDIDEFEDCIDDRDYKDDVEDDFKDGQKRGISGTPSFFINGQKLVGAQPYESFKTAILRAMDGEEIIIPKPEEKPLPPEPTEVLIGIDDDNVKGDYNAPITIIEFGDYQCPFCKRFFDDTLPQLMDEYIDEGIVRYVFRDYALAFHPQAKLSAIASECAGKQDEFWNYHYTLFENQHDLNEENYLEWADDLNLDLNDFEECLNDDDMEDEVDEDMEDGTNAGNRGTPGFFIGLSESGNKMEAMQLKGAQPYAAFEEVIEELLDSIE